MKKIISGLLVAGLFLGGGVTGAAVYHIKDAKEVVKANVDNSYREYMEERDASIKADTTHFTTEEMERLENEVMEYFNDRKSDDYQKLLNEYHKLIEAETNQAIEELKAYVDSLFE